MAVSCALLEVPPTRAIHAARQEARFTGGPGLGVRRTELSRGLARGVQAGRPGALPLGSVQVDRRPPLAEQPPGQLREPDVTGAVGDGEPPCTHRLDELPRADTRALLAGGEPLGARGAAGRYPCPAPPRRRGSRTGGPAPRHRSDGIRARQPGSPPPPAALAGARPGATAVPEPPQVRAKRPRRQGR